MTNPPSSGRFTVLLVEDDPGVLAMIGRMLDRRGYAALSARDGPEAIEIMEKADRIDVLVTDVVMPKGMDGQALAQDVRRRHEGVEVVMISGYPREELVREGRIDEDALLLTKPFSLKELARTIGDLVGDTD